MPFTNQISDQEDALQAVMALYSPGESDFRPYAERRELAMKAVLDQVGTWEAGRRSMVKRVLRVEQLLAAGQIQLPESTRPPEADLREMAKAHYVQAVRADPRLTSRLIRRVGESCPLGEGENLEEHFVRLAEMDFSKGFEDCDFPQLHSAAVEAAQRARFLMADEDGVVDEEQILRDDRVLIEQALQLALRSEERFFGVAAMEAQLTQALGCDDDGIDAQALVLALGSDSGEGRNQAGYDRPRG